LKRRRKKCKKECEKNYNEGEDGKKTLDKRAKKEGCESDVGRRIRNQEEESKRGKREMRKEG
jgi:hypothetical protein